MRNLKKTKLFLGIVGMMKAVGVISAIIVLIAKKKPVPAILYYIGGLLTIGSAAMLCAYAYDCKRSKRYDEFCDCDDCYPYDDFFSTDDSDSSDDEFAEVEE